MTDAMGIQLLLDPDISRKYQVCLPVTMHTACIFCTTGLKVDLLLEITQEDAHERNDLSTEVLVKGREILVQATGCI